MMLTPEEKNRYNRHLILDKVGVKGQEKLKAAKVLVIGAGGLGCSVLQYLTAAGVGNIGIVDFDLIDESNLQRQILFTVNDIGKPKSEIAEKRLKQLNPLVKFTVFNLRLSPQNAENIFKNFDIIVDGTDNFSTRYLVSDTCVKLNKPLVYGSIFKFEGQVSVFNYKGGPSYRCLFPSPPKPNSVPSCSEIGVIGVLPGIIGTQQANETLKIILGFGDPLSGKLLIYNALTTEYLTINILKNHKEVDKITANTFIIAEQDYDEFCEIKQNQSSKKSIDFTTFKTCLNQPDYLIIDVREAWEQPQLSASNLLQIPLDEIDDRLDEIPKDLPVIFICQTGGRSANVIDFLIANYDYTNLINLEGGIKS
ncbi:MAG TPA: molybdopterin-synthase adenylyltransferase MoeB [Crocinitomix sp.]|nr:molybdopterin-synthase adenylyltransferase MoeB [Crocinitomix sp.]